MSYYDVAIYILIVCIMHKKTFGERVDEKKKSHDYGLTPIFHRFYRAPKIPLYTNFKQICENKKRVSSCKGVELRSLVLEKKESWYEEPNKIILAPMSYKTS